MANLLVMDLYAFIAYKLLNLRSGLKFSLAATARLPIRATTGRKIKNERGASVHELLEFDVRDSANVVYFSYMRSMFAFCPASSPSSLIVGPPAAARLLTQLRILLEGDSFEQGLILGSQAAVADIDHFATNVSCDPAKTMDHVIVSLLKIRDFEASDVPRDWSCENHIPRDEMIKLPKTKIGLLDALEKMKKFKVATSIETPRPGDTVIVFFPYEFGGDKYLEICYSKVHIFEIEEPVEK